MRGGKRSLGKGNSSLFSYTVGANAELVQELVNSGEKCTPENIVGITKTSDGKIIWLETGTYTAGLKHIIERHAPQFNGKGISNNEIPNYIIEAIHQENIVGYQRSRTIYEFTYNGKLQRVAVQIGSNGFIIGANPKSMKEG